MSHGRGRCLLRWFVGLVVLVAIAGPLACKKNQKWLAKTPMQARSIHIGLSRVSSNYSTNLDCPSCIKDAEWYAKEAAGNGYSALPPLEDGHAKADIILGTIRAMANDLAKAGGGTLLITFNGHGGLIPPQTPTARTWCAWDHQIRDTQLLAALASVDASVHVIIISDSCYSGGLLTEGGSPQWISVEDPALLKNLLAISKDAQAYLWNRDKEMYLRLEAEAEEVLRTQSVTASVMLIASAGANDLAYYSGQYGYSVFTGNVWHTVKPGKELQKLFDDARIATKQEKPYQNPMLVPLGPDILRNKSVFPPVY
jgi:hypothetical protein